MVTSRPTESSNAPQDAQDAQIAPGCEHAELDGLIRDHAPMVRRALHQLGVPAAQIEDAAQDVFVVLVRRIAEFDADRSLTNWLWGIAKGVASGYRRSRRRRGRLHEALSLTAARPSITARPGEIGARCAGPGRPTWAVPMPSDARAVERSVAGGQAEQILSEFLASLDAGKCSVFVLAEIEGCTGPQIAERLSLNLNTVYARLRAARRAFREAMASQPTQGRPLFAAFVPTVGKAMPMLATAAVATAMVLPSTDLLAPEPTSSTIAGYAAIPDAAPVAATVTPTVLATRAKRRGSSPTAQIPDDDLQHGLAFPFAESTVSFTDMVPAGQGNARGLATTQAQGDETMFAALTLAAAVAAPTPAPTSNEDADAAALVGREGTTSFLEFEGDDVDGLALTSDGSNILHRPRSNFPSLLRIRGHFVPELIRLANDV